MANTHILRALQGSVDTRLLRTQDDMSAALKALWKAGTDYDKVTVALLCQRAGISRQTFYRRYGAIDEIISVDTVRMLNGLLQQIDGYATSDHRMEPRIAAMVHSHRELFAEIAWSHTEETVVKALTGGILRVYGMEEMTIEHRAIVAEMVARSILALGQTLQNHPKLSVKETTVVVKLMMPRVSMLNQRPE